MSEIDITYQCPRWQSLQGDLAGAVHAAAEAALAGPDGAAETEYELSIVLADDAFVQQLNRQYRNIDQPTNVLSFSADEEDEPGIRLLGDVVLAYDTVLQEAQEMGKPVLHHLSHLVVHGILHLLGFDHAAEPEAQQMEAREIAILARLGIADPYQERLSGQNV